MYSEVHPPTRDLAWIRAWKPTGIILSGGPNSVYEDGAPTTDPAVFDVAPVLAICYGMQLVAHLSGGAVISHAAHREYGRAEVTVDASESGLFRGLNVGDAMTVWMSHGDHVDTPPPGYVVTASSRSVPIAAMRHTTKPIHCVQFHPEVAHTQRGGELIANFLFGVCHAQPTWTPGAFVASEIEKVRAMVGTKRVICGLSGGVDSSPSRRRWSIARSAIGSRASSSTRGCCACTSANRSSERSGRTWAWSS